MRGAKRNPLAASITALVVYATLHIAAAALDPDSLPRGIIVKVLIVILLIQSIKAAVARRKLEEQGP